VKFNTINQWDEETWSKVKSIYQQAFAEKGAKPEKIIRNMFRKQICFLHTLEEEEQVLAMALTGRLKGCQSLLIDYLAVNESQRGEGNGHKMLEEIKTWANKEGDFKGLVIEVEADKTPENLARIDFWKSCSFSLTEYIHHYIWVPESYRAMYLKLQPEETLSESGEELFAFIGNFHKESYQGS
jgi:GNAT superfamily N-acetyltransferase